MNDIIINKLTYSDVAAMMYTENGIGAHDQDLDTLQQIQRSRYEGVLKLNSDGKAERSQKAAFELLEDINGEAGIDQVVTSLSPNYIATLQCIAARPYERLNIIDGYNQAVKLRIEGSPSAAAKWAQDTLKHKNTGLYLSTKQQSDLEEIAELSTDESVDFIDYSLPTSQKLLRALLVRVVKQPKKKNLEQRAA